MLSAKLRVPPTFPLRGCRHAVLCILFTFQPALAQDVLQFSGSNAVHNGSASVNVVLTSPAGSQPASLEWSLAYPTSGISSVAIVPGAQALSASKFLTCTSKAGSRSCVLTGLINNNQILNGVVAVVELQLPATATVIPPGFKLTSAVGALPNANAVSVSIGPWGVPAITVTGLACNPTTLTAPGSSSCTVTLSGPAGSSGLSVAIGLATTSATATSPASVTVQSGKTSATFSVNVSAATGAGTVIVTASADASSASASLAVTPAFTPIRVAAGYASTYTDPQGHVWSADYGYSGGSSYSTSASISNTTTPTLYQQDRWQQGGFHYTFTVANGARTVTLKFADIYFTQPGKRSFNVLINGTTVLSNFDIVAQAGGGFTALDRSFPVNVTGGTVTIQFSPVLDNPQISAIAIQ